jgi:hypothetical protein
MMMTLLVSMSWQLLVVFNLVFASITCLPMAEITDAEQQYAAADIAVGKPQDRIATDACVMLQQRGCVYLS